MNGDISGTGSIEIDGAIVNDPYNDTIPTYVGGTMEFNGATSENVVFAGAGATLQLDQPASFTGTISTTGANNQTGMEEPDSYSVILGGVSLSSVTDYTYSGNTAGGTLTITTTGGALSLKFSGAYSLVDFSLSAAPEPNSTSPPGLIVFVSIPLPVTISAAVASQTISDKQTATPFSGVTIADPNSGATDSVSLTLSNPANGMLSTTLAAEIMTRRRASTRSRGRPPPSPRTWTRLFSIRPSFKRGGSAGDYGFHCVCNRHPGTIGRRKY